MLGQNQTEIHQFDVCGRVYYRGINYTEKDGELAVETYVSSEVHLASMF
ncbi:hypothetical protein [Shewanella baltica]|nr:hypothetical protein [Shewanella baltica]MCS6207454.1 hypothetical protein [Shewanella baltica]